MGKSDTPILDGICAFLALASMTTKKRRPQRRVTITQRQTYDAKRGQVITLTTKTATYTETL